MRPERPALYQQPGVVLLTLGSGLLLAGASYGWLSISSMKPDAGDKTPLYIAAPLLLGGAALVTWGAIRKRRGTRAHNAQTFLLPSISPDLLGVQAFGRF